MAPLIAKLKTRQTYLSTSIPETHQEYLLLKIYGFPHPYVVLETEPNGSCGFQSIVCWLFPSWEVDMPEFQEFLCLLRLGCFMFNKETWTKEMKINLADAYPFLKEKGTVKENYVENFRLLEMSYSGIVSLSLILNITFLILRLPFNGPPSVL